MQEPFETPSRDNRIVYVKTVDVSDLPTEVQGKIEGLEQLYAVHDSDGQQLALVADRKLAFVLARQNDYAPVPVH
ncbi:DUF1150 domain-containing protein [Roseobacter denitrificans]|uniref:DUF1150 family protein n=1 Tax=Roseobacter denitrificans (strain ATCC 33942 / OCh 114) TaxID=375451 RepID=Q162V3_ROSDO|nr:DUF1150 family protein [Roseobacter denitrificans]ABG32990.1 conserved hypothetical protein [Roseobacter denitrificans OCh 114]AVL52371.1 DUF1150 domain-containing protein [Roseobacter denitrificans]SFG09957.1 Protein of unknown function [Roseobacter denitrificans OCh 114]